MASRKTHILLVEDEQAHADLITRYLNHRASQFEVEHVSTLADAKALLTHHSPDLILTDLRLPDGSGMELLPNKESNFEGPVMVMTSQGNEEVAVKAIKAGASDYLVKSPDAFREIGRSLHRALRDWQQERKLEEAELKLHSVLDNANAIVYLKDLNGRFQFANRQFLNHWHLQRDDVIDKTAQEIFDESIAQDFENHDKIALQENEPFQSELEMPMPDGNRIFLTNKFPVYDLNNEITGMCAICHDITDRKEAEAQVEHMARHDILTGLPNRSLFNSSLEVALNSALHHGERGAVFYIDLDHFKEINDTLGHATGDELLKDVASRLRKGVKEQDLVARIGGDEFAMILKDIRHPEDAGLVAQRTLNELEAPFHIENHTFDISASIGIAIFPDDSNNVQDLMKFVDLAMYSAKSEGRNAYRYYHAAMNRSLLRKKQIAQDLRRAFRKNEFELHFQPQINIRTGELIGLESLIRWHQPGAEQIATEEFISIAEQIGLILKLGDWTLDCVAQQMADWRGTPLEGLCVAINLSALQFRQPDLANLAAKALKRYGLQPEQLEVEITESALMDDMQTSIRTMQTLRDIGMPIAIDDFGTGYSSLSYLKQFPIHKIKIDRSFIHDIEYEQDSATIARAVVSLGHSLEMEVLAEGVENERQLEYLRRCKCDAVQGYLVGKPMQADQLQDWLQHYRTRATKT